MRTIWTTHVRSFSHFRSISHFLKKTLFNVIKVLVKVRNEVMVRDKVRFRAGIHGWNVYYRGSVIPLDFIHNPAHSTTTRKVTFHVPLERHGM